MKFTLCTKLCTLQLIGVNAFYFRKSKSSVKSYCISRCFALWLIIACAINFYHMYCLVIEPAAGIIMTFSYIISTLSYYVTYLTLWCKRNYLLEVRRVIKKIGVKGRSKVYLLLNMLQIINIIVFLICPAALVYLSTTDSILQDIILKDLILYVFIFYAYVFNQITLPLLITSIHASICMWCSTTLKNIKENIDYCKMQLNYNEIISVLQFFHSVLHVASLIEITFSNVSLLSLFSYLISIFFSIGFFLKGVEYDGITTRVLFSVSLFFNIFGMTVLIACVSEVPIIIEEIKLSLLLLDEKLSLRGPNKRSQTIKILIDTLLKRGVFFFSACKMIRFRRSLIITCYGMLISYGLLLYSIEKSP